MYYRNCIAIYIVRVQKFFNDSLTSFEHKCAFCKTSHDSPVKVKFFSVLVNQVYISALNLMIRCYACVDNLYELKYSEFKTHFKCFVHLFLNLWNRWIGADDNCSSSNFLYFGLRKFSVLSRMEIRKHINWNFFLLWKNSERSKKETLQNNANAWIHVHITHHY